MFKKAACILLFASQFCLLTHAANFDRVSISSNGEEGDGNSFASTISADGRYIAFESRAKNLVQDDNDRNTDIFLHDQKTGITKRVNISVDSKQGIGQSSYPKISADGRYIVFGSGLKLVENDNNNTSDIFLYNIESGKIELISVSSNGIQSNAGSRDPSISSDGRFVVFMSPSTNLDDTYSDLNGDTHIFIRDRELGITELVSVSSAGELANTFSVYPSASDDGRFVVFHTRASNLIEGDTNGLADVFARDRITGKTIHINSSISVAVGDDYGATLPKISADGRFVSFSSSSPNLVINDTNNREDTFVHEIETGLIELVSVSSIGEQSDGHSSISSISDDGRFIAFESRATNLDNSDNNYISDIFVRDRKTGETNHVGNPSLGVQSNSDSSNPHISLDGKFIVFISSADNLIERDTNGFIDVFVTENPLVPKDIVIEKKLNGDSSIVGSNESIANFLVGRPYRADYTVKNLSAKRIYGIKVFDDDQGNNQLACNLYTLNPGENTRCYRFYQTQSGRNAVPARVEAKISGEGRLISDVTPQVSYVGHDALSGGLSVKHSLNDEPGDNESNAVMLSATADQSWLFKVTNNSNIDVYKIKVYNDGVFPQDPGWEELCLIGKLQVGKTRYCKRVMSAGETGLNLMMGRAQGNDAYVVGSHQYINAANPTYYRVEP